MLSLSTRGEPTERSGDDNTVNAYVFFGNQSRFLFFIYVTISFSIQYVLRNKKIFLDIEMCINISL